MSYSFYQITGRHAESSQYENYPESFPTRKFQYICQSYFVQNRSTRQRTKNNVDKNGLLTESAAEQVVVIVKYQFSKKVIHIGRDMIMQNALTIYIHCFCILYIIQFLDFNKRYELGFTSVSFREAKHSQARSFLLPLLGAGTIYFSVERDQFYGKYFTKVTTLTSIQHACFISYAYQERSGVVLS